MNFERWSHLTYPIQANDTTMERMDFRHVQIIHALLMSERPKSVVEIGIANGFSTAAIIEAIEAGVEMEVDLIDATVRDCVKTSIQGIPGITIHQMDSQSYEKRPECWIIDGNHREVASNDYANARKAEAQIIIAHDTNPEFEPTEQFGSIAIGKRMREESVCFFEDKQHRHREFTNRGLTIAFYRPPKVGTFAAMYSLCQ